MYRLALRELLEEPRLYILVGIGLDLGEAFDLLHLIQQSGGGFLAFSAVGDVFAHILIGQVLILIGALLGSFSLHELEAREAAAQLDHFLILRSTKGACLAQEGGGQGDGLVDVIDIVLLHGVFLSFVYSCLFQGLGCLCFPQPCD